MASTEAIVDLARARWWLTNLARPERLADPHMRALLRAHGRTAEGSPLEVGRAGARLLADAVAGLATTGLPHRVLETCFVEGLKSRAAAARLGLSERQLSRERSRAISLLVEHLAPAPGRVPCGDPPPLPEPFLARPHVARRLADELRARRRVRVTGVPGSGKTALVAAHAAESSARVFWYRPGPRGHAELPALLFDLGEHLARDDPSLAAYVRGTLPALDVALATRIALAGLARRERLLVFDDSGGIASDVDSFLCEAVERLPSLSVVEIGTATGDRPCVAVPPLDPEEARAYLGLAGLPGDEELVAHLHAWTGGNARLVAAAASWLARPEDARRLEDALRSRSAVVVTMRGMTGAARRAPVALSA